MAAQRGRMYNWVNPYADCDGSGSLTTRYLVDPRQWDGLLARVGGDGGPQWYLRDNIHSVRQIVGPDGTVLDAITYDSFGRVVSETNPAAGDRFQYTGREYDAELGLYYYRARYYDPSTGRFLSEDPLSFAAGDSNLYRYVDNVPTIYVDPSGMIWQEIKDWWNRNNIGTRILGGCQVIGGACIVYLGIGIAMGGTIFGCGVGGVVTIPWGGAIAVVGFDQMIAGFRTMWDGEHHTSFIGQGIDAAFGGGGDWYDAGVDLVLGARGAYQIYKDWPKIVNWCKDQYKRFLGQKPPAPAETPSPTAGVAKTPADSLLAASNTLAAPPIPSLTDLAKLGAAPGKGNLTKAGHSLTKHAAGKRPGSSAFPDPKGNPSLINQQAQEILEDILNHPAKVVKLRPGPRGEQILQIHRPDGSGVIFKWDGKEWRFSHFAENLF